MSSLLLLGERRCVLPNSELNELIKTVYPFSKSVTLHVQKNTFNNQVIELYPDHSLKPEAYLKIFLRQGKLFSHRSEIFNTLRFCKEGFSLAPNVLYFDSQGYFYLVTQRMVGRPGNSLQLNSSQLEMVEQCLQTLHSNLSAYWGPFGRYRNLYASYEINNLLLILKKVGIVLQDNAINAWLTRLNRIDRFSFCQGEPILEHLMLDGHRIGFVDWEASGYYHPFLDWSAWIHSLLIYGYYTEAMKIIVSLQTNDMVELLPFFFAQRLLLSAAYPRNRRIIDQKTQRAYFCAVEKILGVVQENQHLGTAIEFIYEHASRLREQSG
jgi:hypothetical protein